MPKLVLSTGCTIANSICSSLSVKKWLSGIFLLLCLSINLFAEGSREISANGGYRVLLFSSATGNSSFPFPTLGTMKVYVKVGEMINVGSSVQGMNYGTINLRAPDGATYTSGINATVGLIANRNQELAGPLPNAGGYTPFTKTVQPGQEGVWEIDFISESNGLDDGNPVPVQANAAWVQPAGQYIDAFDVSVRDVTNTKFIGGRVFTNIFSGIMGTFNVGFNGIFHILTKDGYQYTLDNNGQAGNGFTFFVNNKGFRNADGTASYQSVNSVDNPNVQDPRIADTQSDITQKIFFNTPATDLPDSANTPEGIVTWLLSSPAAPTLSSIVFTGIEGTAGEAGTNPLGANFTFNASDAGSHLVAIDVDKNGIFTDPVDRKLTGTANPGMNQVYWDGLDGFGKKVPGGATAAYTAKVTFTAKAGEVHFPFFDVERNVYGMKLVRINGNFAPDDTLYWDDSAITIVGTPSNPIKNLTGISSNVNGHKWGTPAPGPLDDQDFGNNKSIDTWSYTSSAPILSAVGFQLREADLAVDTITAVTGCAGAQVIYNVTVSNKGPDDVTGAKFRFNFPNQLSGVIVGSAATNGSSAISAGVVSANAYDANMDMANGSVRTFTITGNILASATGGFNVSASITRPADVTDPDATNPDAAPPTYPENECNSLPSGPGCNNIKTYITSFIGLNAGPDQTIFEYENARLKATGQGTWTQAAGDPAIVTIVNPVSSTTEVTGFNSLGIYHFIFTNTNNCTDTVLVNVRTTDMVIPNIFTPNNDGKNDLFKIADLDSFPGSQLLIFNRWGNEVYRADNYLNNWDGSGLAEGTYYYILNRREHNGSITIFKGWVFLKRSK